MHSFFPTRIFLSSSSSLCHAQIVTTWRFSPVLSLIRTRLSELGNFNVEMTTIPDVVRWMCHINLSRIEACSRSVDCSLSLHSAHKRCWLFWWSEREGFRESSKSKRHIKCQLIWANICRRVWIHYIYMVFLCMVRSAFNLSSARLFEVCMHCTFLWHVEWFFFCIFAPFNYTFTRAFSMFSVMS